MAPVVLVGVQVAWAFRRGGSIWTWLSWVIGLQRAGVDVIVVDQLDLNHCVWPPGVERSYENALNLDAFDAIITRLGLRGKAALLGSAGEPLRGLSIAELEELADSADALVNIAGALRLESIKARVRRRVLVDIDPGLTHYWLALGRPAPRVEGHNVHFTIGENIGLPFCPIPTGAIRWRHTRQPVLLDQWPFCEPEQPWRFTTVAKWRGAGPHGDLAGAGLSVTDKADEFLRVAELPRLCPERFELALDDQADPAETERMVENGWSLRRAILVAGDEDAFRLYVQSSGGEFSVAKGVYVSTDSGWFSSRSTRYLASGKPALVQETGFSRNIPVGEGLLSFRTVEEAASGARQIAADYAHHCASARTLAEEHLGTDRVLGRFLDEALSAPI